MSPVLLVFHTIAKVKLISKMYLKQIHLFYNIRYPCFNSQASLHSFSVQATQHKQFYYSAKQHQNKDLTLTSCSKLSLGTSLVWEPILGCSLMHNLSPLRSRVRSSLTSIGLNIPYIPNRGVKYVPK